jgi:hypothetical protein
MKNKVKKEGKYELFSTTNKNTILSLEGTKWFAVAKGQRGDILVRSDSDHEKRKTLQKGKFYLVNFKDDPDFQDMPHLFLKKGAGKFEEWVLPRSLPTKKEKTVKLIKAGSVSASKLKNHLKNKAKGKPNKGKSSKVNDLQSKKKSELYDLARKNKIKGRSKMGKKELIRELAGRV